MKKTYQVSFNITVDENEDVSEIVDTMRSMLSFGSDEYIEGHVEYRYNNFKVEDLK